MRNLGSALTLGLVLAAIAGSGARADTFNFSGAVVTYTIPTTAVYEIVAAGAQGGASNIGTPGGLGALVSGAVFLTAGTVLDVVVGGSPLPLLAHSGLSDGGGGGGGGSFVFEPFAFIPLIIAGGGGGAAESLVPGGPGQTGTNGEDADGGGAGGPYFGGVVVAEPAGLSAAVLLAAQDPLAALAATARRLSRAARGLTLRVGLAAVAETDITGWRWRRLFGRRRWR